MKKIVITGGAGFVGTKLAEALLARGYSVHVLDRGEPRIKHSALAYTVCDTTQSVPADVLDGAYGVINLAGKTIGEHWTKQVKQDIRNSRIQTTHNLVDAISATRLPPTVLVSASAVGYYGNTGEKYVDELSPAGGDFLATVARDWETEVRRAEVFGVRVAHIRTAHVIGAGGLVASLAKVFKKHLGGYFGSGRQYMPWVSIDDIVNIYIFLLEHPSASGPYNTGAGAPLSQKSFMRTFARARGYWPVWWIPAFTARLVLGEFAESLLTGQRVSSDKLRKLGYVFKYEKLEEVLKGGK